MEIVASEEWLVASESLENATGAIPGKHTKSAQGIEKEGDGFRSGAKERQRVSRERWRVGELEVQPSGET
jgi:hypothetical protein